MLKHISVELRQKGRKVSGPYRKRTEAVHNRSASHVASSYPQPFLFFVFFLQENSTVALSTAGDNKLHLSVDVLALGSMKTAARHALPLKVGFWVSRGP